MATKFDPAPESVTKVVYDVLDKHRPALTDAGVTVGVFLASGWIDDGGDVIEKPALTRHGRAVLVLVEVNNHKKRAAGLPDVSLFVDNDNWNLRNADRQTAAIDSGLTSLELVTDAKTGAVKRDAGGRPRLRVVPGDMHVDGHSACVRRHGKAAVEAVALVEASRLVQGEFAWG